MKPVPYLFFNGNCAAAMDAYARDLNAEILHQMRGSDMPPDDDFDVPADRANWIMHGMMKVGDGIIMMSDTFTGTSDAMAGCSVMLNYPTLAEARAIFEALAKDGKVTMAFEQTFWSKGFGTCIDRFGVRWMIGCDEEPD